MKIKLEEERSFFLNGKLISGKVIEIKDKTVKIEVKLSDILSKTYTVHINSILK